MERIEYANIVTEEAFKLLKEIASNGKLDDFRFLIDLFDKRKRQLIMLRNKNINEVYNFIIEDYLKYIDEVASFVPGISTAIKDSKNDVEIYTYSGKTSKNGVTIDENVRFDMASITKFFTVLEALKLNENGLFDLRKNVSYFNPKYNLEIPVEEMIKFYYELRTDGRLDEKDISLEEIKRRLYATKVVKEKTFIYSDIPLLILKDIMPFSDEYFKKYFNDELNMLLTSYDNFGVITGGNYNELDKLHDPKARVFKKYNIKTGHAGIYSTSKDLVKLFDGLENGFLNHDSITNMITPILEDKILLDEEGNIKFRKDKFGEINDVHYINRAMDVYIKHPGGIRSNELVRGLSDEAFSVNGFTGTYATYDLKNGITANILTNPLSGDEEKIIKSQYAFPSTRIKIKRKIVDILDEEENVVERIKFNRMTNALKEMQIYTLFSLRLVRNVYNRLSFMNNDENLHQQVTETFGKVKIIKK